MRNKIGKTKTQKTGTCWDEICVPNLEELFSFVKKIDLPLHNKISPSASPDPRKWVDLFQF